MRGHRGNILKSITKNTIYIGVVLLPIAANNEEYSLCRKKLLLQFLYNDLLKDGYHGREKKLPQPPLLFNSFFSLKFLISISYQGEFRHFSGQNCLLTIIPEL